MRYQVDSYAMVSFVFWQSTPLLSSPGLDPHPPTPFVIRARWASFTGYEAGLGSPPEDGDRRRLVVCEPVA